MSNSNRAEWLQFAWTDLGTAAAPGPVTSEKVHGYYISAGHPEIAGDETAWCAAFVGACLERAGIPCTRSLLARSYLTFGSANSELDAGAIAVFSRGSDPQQGHVAFVVGQTADSVIALGGNQSRAVTVMAIPRTRLLAVRWPVAPHVLTQTTADAKIDSPVAATTADENFATALAHVLLMEGGYSDDPYDPGGPTNLGITLADLAAFRAVEVSAATTDKLTVAIKALTPADVAPIYLERYWRPSSAPFLPPPLAFFHFDTAVNQGLSAAARMLQEAVGTAIDGDIGPLTLTAAARDSVIAIDRYAEIRRDRYRALPTFWRFGRGWLARVDATLCAAKAFTATDHAIPPQQKETTMTTAPAQNPSLSSGSTATAPSAKWWGQSLTIWGTIVTALATVLPIAGPLIGLDVTAEMVRQLGDGVVQVIQALGGVIGVVMAIYGRTRAVQPLVRRDFMVKL